MSNKWDERFIKMAKLVGEWSSCYRSNRQVGAVVVVDKRIMATGYNGAPQGIMSCVERRECLRDKLNIPSGTQHEICFGVHAEQNAIAQCARLGISIEGGTMYVTHQPCTICTKIIINAGIKRVVYLNPYPDDFSQKLFDEAEVVLEQYKEEV